MSPHSMGRGEVGSKNLSKQLLAPEVHRAGGFHVARTWPSCPLTDRNSSQMETAHFLGVERCGMAVGETGD